MDNFATNSKPTKLEKVDAFVRKVSKPRTTRHPDGNRKTRRESKQRI